MSARVNQPATFLASSEQPVEATCAVSPSLTPIHEDKIRPERLPLSITTQVVPPAWRPFVTNRWQDRHPMYFQEFEDLWWIYDGWDAVADEAIVKVMELEDWRAKLRERRGALHWFDERHGTLIADFNATVKVVNGYLSDAAGLCYLRRHYCDVHGLDRGEKNLSIGKLRHEAVILNEHLTEELRRLKRNSSENSTPRISNVLITFLNTPRGDTKRFEMLQRGLYYSGLCFTSHKKCTDLNFRRPPALHLAD
ncbi:hypothetical protein JCM11251_000336 [Rhodosporidiobolus azoricus]